MLHETGDKSIEIVIKEPGLPVGKLCQAFAAARACAETQRSIHAKQVVVSNFERSACMFEFLISHAICEQNGLCVFNLNQDVPDARNTLLQRHNFHAAEETRCVEFLLSFKYGFRIIWF